MRDLIPLFDQVQFWCHTWVALEVCFPYLEEFLDRVLNPPFNFTVVEDHPESFENGVDTCWGCFGEDLAGVDEKLCS